MIFKSTQFTDDKGNVSDRLTWAFKGVGDGKKLGNTKKVTLDSDKNISDLTLEKDRLAWEAYNQAVERNIASGKQYADAMAVARTEVGETSASLEKYHAEMARVYETETDAAVRQQKSSEIWAQYEKDIDAVNTANQKAAKSFKGLSASTKALAGNIALDLGIGLAISGIIALWNKLNDEFKITPAKKIEAMEQAVNDYNTAMEESQNGIKTIQSLESEFNTLAKGVDENGRNIGLSAEEYDRYNEIVREKNRGMIQNHTSYLTILFSQ